MAMSVRIIALGGLALAAVSAVGPGALEGAARADGRRDTALAAAWRQALSLSPRPATWAARREDFEAALLGQAPADLAAFAADQLKALHAEIRAARATPRRLKRLGPGCIGAALRECRVLARGRLDLPDGTQAHWRIQRGFTEQDGARGGVVLMQRAPDGYATIGWSFEGYDWNAPTISRHGAATLLAVAGRRPGSGQGNADVLFRKDGLRWSEVENESWKEDLARALPEDRDVRRGVVYDFAAFTAHSPLWRRADADCCPTGGWVRADLALVAQRVALAGVVVDPQPARPPAATLTTPE